MSEETVVIDGKLYKFGAHGIPFVRDGEFWVVSLKVKASDIHGAFYRKWEDQK